jgi:alanine racemase
MGPSILEIDLAALAHNYHYLRSKISSETMLLGVVKANGYGSEAISVAKKLDALGVDYLGVAYTHEGVFLREQGIKTPILVLHPQPEEFKHIIEHCLEPSLYSNRTLQMFMEATEKEYQYPIHLNINTGLNRLGFPVHGLEAICQNLLNSSRVKVKGIMSHLAATDDLSEKAYTDSQIEKFKEAVTSIEEKIGKVPLKHLLNSSGILNFPEAAFNMVRSGIALYGYGNHSKIDSLLKPVATLTTKISQIHSIEKGSWVGYNKGFVAAKKMRIATLTIGHADGISRVYGQGKGVVFVKGKPCPIIGNVCMDMLMIDLENHEAKEGDSAVIFGKGASAETFAHGAKTISYELLTGIGARVKRVIVG